MNQYLQRKISLFYWTVYCCTICTKSYKSDYQLNIHIEETHTNKPPPMKDIFSCIYCDKNYDSEIQLSSHIEDEHSSHSTEMQVTRSDSSSTTDSGDGSSSVQHINCKVCKLECHTNSELNNHVGECHEQPSALIHTQAQVCLNH